MQRADAAPVSPAKASAPPLTPPPGGRRRCRPEKERKMRKPPIFGALTLLASTPALLAATPAPAQAATPPTPAHGRDGVGQVNLHGRRGKLADSSLQVALYQVGDPIGQVGAAVQNSVDRKTTRMNSN